MSDRSRKRAVSKTRVSVMSQADSTRQRIAECSIQLFSERGFSDVSTTDVAKAAGVSQSLVLYHFETKENLWRSSMSLLFARVNSRHPSDVFVYRDLDPLARLKVSFRRLVGVSARYPELGRVIMREGAEESDRLEWLATAFLGEAYREYLENFRSSIENGQIKPYPPALLTIVAHSAATMVFNLAPLMKRVFDFALDDEDSWTRHADLVVDVLLNGLLQKPPSQGALND